jgi:hypothetical protein
MLIDNNALPGDLKEWSAEFASAVSQARQRWNDATAGQECEREVITAEPLWTQAQVLWPWLAATILLGLNAVLYFRT